MGTPPHLSHFFFSFLFGILFSRLMNHSLLLHCHLSLSFLPFLSGRSVFGGRYLYHLLISSSPSFSFWIFLFHGHFLCHSPFRYSWLVFSSYSSLPFLFV